MSPDRVELAEQVHDSLTIQVPRDRRGRIRWSVLKQDPAQLAAVIESEISLLLTQGVQPNHKELVKSGSSRLSSAIIAHYPGAYTGLRQKLELPIKRKPPHYWTPEHIQEEAREFCQPGERLTHTILLRGGRADLADVISAKYPGGIFQLRRDLNMDNQRKPNGYWNQENIEAEAKEFAKQHGDLTNNLLRKQARFDLSTAISSSYPGGIMALKGQLGVESKKQDSRGRIKWSALRDSPEEIKQIIESQARKFISDGHSLRHKDLDEAGWFNFSHMISGSYPGGIAALRKELSLPKGKAAGGYWRNPKLIEIEAQHFLEEHGNLTGGVLKSNGRGDLLGGIKRYYPGGITQLQIYLGIEPQAPKLRRENSKNLGYWTPERIEEEALEFYRQNGKLTVTALKRADRTDLLAVIARYAKGGFKTLKEKLGIELGRRDGFWSVEQIETEAREFVTKYGDLTYTLFSQYGRSDFGHAISRYYPGKMRALREYVGLKTTRKELGYWNLPENIEMEAWKFYQTYGDLSQSLLYRHRMSGLSLAISRKYPGSFRGLKEKLGIDVLQQEPTISSDEANEQLRRLLEDQQ